MRIHAELVRALPLSGFHSEQPPCDADPFDQKFINRIEITLSLTLEFHKLITLQGVTSHCTHISLVMLPMNRHVTSGSL